MRMRLSMMPFGGTDSADAAMEWSKVPAANVAATYARPVRQIRILSFMVRLLRSGLLVENLGFGSKIDDLEAERIPSARLRVLRWIRICVLNGRHPVGK